MIEDNQFQFSNLHFWHGFIALYRGFDEQKQLNLDEAIQDQLGLDLYALQLEDDNPSLLMPPKHAIEPIQNYQFSIDRGIQFDIIFERDEIVYYLNDFYIGNIGGHFKAWFLTLNEFLSFNLSDVQFLLLLPMLAIEPQQCLEAKARIAEKLHNIVTFQGHEDYIADCIVNGLKMNHAFYQQDPVGICNRQNHSIRHVEQYPDDLEHVQMINSILRN